MSADAQSRRHPRRASFGYAERSRVVRTLCLLMVGFQVSACVMLEPDPQFDPKFGTGAILYAARFPDWVVEVREDGVTLREGADITFYSRSPTALYGQTGNRYEGSAHRTFIVEGNAQTETISFRMDVEFSPCEPGVGPSGTSVAYLALDGETTPVRGCGGPPVRHPISRLP